MTAIHESAEIAAQLHQAVCAIGVSRLTGMNSEAMSSATHIAIEPRRHSRRGRVSAWQRMGSDA
jgi:hypothetical protein